MKATLSQKLNILKSKKTFINYTLKQILKGLNIK